jgi:hypothetical protein
VVIEGGVGSLLRGRLYRGVAWPDGVVAQADSSDHHGRGLDSPAGRSLCTQPSPGRLWRRAVLSPSRPLHHDSLLPVDVFAKDAGADETHSPHQTVGPSETLFRTGMFPGQRAPLAPGFGSCPGRRAVGLFAGLGGDRERLCPRSLPRSAVPQAEALRVLHLSPPSRSLTSSCFTDTFRAAPRLGSAVSVRLLTSRLVQ